MSDTLIVHWDFDPILLSIGSFSIHWYGLLFALAFIAGYHIMQLITKAEGRTDLDLDTLLYYIMGGTIVGARLAHCLFYDPTYYLSHPLDIFKIWEGGLASHGGAVGLILALYFYAKRYDVSFLWLTDRIAIPSALGGAMVRLANFLNSEIVGNPTHSNWGVIFEKVDELPRHPVQLYESFAYIMIFAWLVKVYLRYGKNTPYGLLTGMFLTSVFSVRFILEFFKTPQAAYEAGNFISVGQWLSIPFIIVGIVLIQRAKRAPAMNIL